jgi:bifunctional UDP-N-acetylglucosamine pyrophosphorylase/glucosamine-1-phosphate N-acetyltransferase
VLTAVLPDPTGYGRIVPGRDNSVARIVEHADTSADEAAINEINTGIYVFRRTVLAPALRRLSPENAQGEYYLTDVVEVLYDAGYPVATQVISDPMEAAGVNDRAQLAVVEAELRRRTNGRWMRRGVTMLDPERTYLDSSVELAPDVTQFPGTLLQGHTVVATGCEIGPNAHLIDCVVAEDATVTASVARSAEIGAGAVVGPFANLLPGARVAPGTVTGPCFTGGADD